MNLYDLKRLVDHIVESEQPLHKELVITQRMDNYGSEVVFSTDEGSTELGVFNNRTRFEKGKI